MALIVLGAGATRGASFCSGAGRLRLCKPPVDGDFFTQLQRISNDKHRATIDALLENVISHFGHNFSLGLERVFTVFEFYQRVKSAIATDSSKALDFTAARSNLLQALAAVLEESLTDSTPDGSGSTDMIPCEYHRQLVEKLNGNDTIMSFNYDCLIDLALKRHGSGRWNPHYGYNLPLRKGPNSRIAGEEAWQPSGTVAAKDKTITLLKLHGSLHFAKAKPSQSGSPYRLKQHPYTRRNGRLQFEIIPPEWNKKFDDALFGRLWKAAATAIRAASTVVVIGYSFPLTDLHTESLFRVAVKPGRFKHVVLVNPDRDARRRALAVLSTGLTKSTRVLVFDSFQAFSEAPRSLWDLPKKKTPKNPTSSND